MENIYVFAEGEILDTTDRNKTKIYNNDDMIIDMKELKVALEVAEII